MSGRASGRLLGPPRLSDQYSVLAAQRVPDRIEKSLPFEQPRGVTCSLDGHLGLLVRRVPSHNLHHEVSVKAKRRQINGLAIGPQRAGSVVGPELQDVHSRSLTTFERERTDLPLMVRGSADERMTLPIGSSA